MSRKPENVTVRRQNDESTEHFIRRFMRDCKKEQIVREYLERTRYYKKPSAIRREQKHRSDMRRKRLLEEPECQASTKTP